MSEPRVPYWVPLELYTQSRILSGYIRCPRELRLLDLLNGAGSAENGASHAFFEFLDDTTTSGEESTYQERLREYVRKAAVQLIATSDVNLARGAGARSSAKGYPYLPKSPVAVSLQLPTYTLTGCAYCSPGQSLYEVLNEDRLFIPLTGVTIAHQYGPHAIRPFVAVNKAQVTSSREEDPATLAPL
jgi:hypothetical protein